MRCVVGPGPGEADAVHVGISDGRSRGVHGADTGDGEAMREGGPLMRCSIVSPRGVSYGSSSAVRIIAGPPYV